MRKKYSFIHVVHIQLTWIAALHFMDLADAILPSELYSKARQPHLLLLGKSHHEKSTWGGKWESQPKRSRMKRSNGKISSVMETFFLSCNDTDQVNENVFLPTCDDIHNVERILSSYNLSDPHILRILRHELLVCKNKDFCRLHGYHSIIPNGLYSCCQGFEECSCKDDCKHGGNCCVGSVESFEELERANSGKSCYRPQLVPNNPNIGGELVYMVDTCNDGSIGRDIVDKCTKRPDIFDQDLYVFIPVCSKRNKLTVYKNKYCALCNSHKEDELVYWKIKVKCITQRQHFVFKTLRNLFQFVRDDQINCNMIYEQPDGFGKLSPCQKADVETCPDTPTTDPFYSKACEAYTSIYAPFTGTSIDDITYKNVFCYLCHGNNLKDSPNKCVDTSLPPDIQTDVFPFTILLDFNSLVPRPKDPLSTRCSGSQRFDTLMNECRDLFCTNNLVLKNASCSSPLDEESRRSYSIRYQLYNKTVLPYEDTQDQLLRNYHKGRILFEVVRLFWDLYTEEHICRAVISDVYENGMFSNETLQTEYIAIDFDLEVFDIHTFSNITKNLLSLSGKIINVTSANGTVLYEIRVSNISIDSTSFMAPPLMRIPSTLVERSRVIIDKLKYIYENGTRNLRCGIRPVRFFSVTQFALCPKISIPVSSIKTMKDGSVCLDDRGCYQKGSFQTIDDKVFLCAEDYFRNIPNSKEFQVNSEIQSILSIICTSLSVLCLLLTLVTYSIFSSLRTLPGRNNMALISTLMCAQLLYQFGIDRTENSIVCGLFGILIHFTWLSSICWMNVCTYHMFHTFVWDMMRPSTKDNLSIKKYLLFYTIYSLTLPAVFVSANVITSLVKSGFRSYGYGSQICYILSSYMIGFTFALPVGILLLINLILFLVVIYKIQRAPKVKSTNHDSRRNFLVFIKLSCITGLFWLIGFIYQWLKFEALGYVFIVLNASQGVFIMFAFVCNKRIVGLYKNRFVKKDTSKTSRSSHETKFTNLTRTTNQ